jgi:hypothetical protein
MGSQAWKRALATIASTLDPLSKLAQIAAVVIAGVWAYRAHLLSGEDDLVPEVWVSTQAVAYNQDTRLLVVHIREKNVGKVPLDLKPDSLTLTVKKIPDSLRPGLVKMNGQPALYQEKHLLEQGGPYLSPGAEQEDVAEIVVTPGMYLIEARFALPDGDFASHAAFQKVD